MTNQRKSARRSKLMCGAAMAMAISASPVFAQEKVASIDIPAQPMASALRELARQSGANVLFSPAAVKDLKAPALQTSATAETAAQQLLAGTDLSVVRDPTGSLVIRRFAPQAESASDGADGTVEALIVTAQKREEDIQDVPIAISAFSQEDLTRSQVAGGPDLMTQVPNMTFTKTNFSSYSIQIRGIGTQAISATTDAAVAVAFNNTPFIRNRFFEQEFYDLQRIEVLRGPQGTLYGRNATAGVVNIISQKPKFAYEAKLSGDVSNYNSTRLEGMMNVPLVDDVVALRLAGAWTKRNGYVTNEITGNPIDGRDLWSTRVSLRVAPTDGIEANLIWEHFEEDDDRLRSGKQLCHQDDREEIGGYHVNPTTGYSNIFSQGCIAASMYSPDSFEAPNGYSLPYYLPLANLNLPAKAGFNPYSSLVQSRDLRVIESTIDPEYRATSDLIELQLSVDIDDALTLTSETGYNYDEIFSLQDYNRFNTARGAFGNPDELPSFRDPRDGVLIPGEFGAFFCDPQLGCADRVVAMDVSTARSRQFSQEFRLSSDFDGSLNFSLGVNFLRYDTEDKYYVFINTLSMFAALGGYDVPHKDRMGDYIPGVTDNRECLPEGGRLPNPRVAQLVSGCVYMDPNPIGSLNDMGHNYFLSKNPYKLISYAVFGEAYYNITDALKVTAGLRWTVDKKEAPRIPSWVVASDTLGYPVLEVEEQEWREPTGRLAVDWKPDFGFTDETLLYASYAHGYKAGGSNPPPSGVVAWGLSTIEGNIDDLGPLIVEQSAAKPKIFDPEFVDAFEVGAKNTLLDGRLTLNVNAFYYDYTSYQISQIIDRSAVNYNFDAKVWGLEIEADWRPLENLRVGFKGGYENTRVADGERAIDIMDRTGGHDDWVVVRPFPTYPSNCIVPLYTVTGVGDSLRLGPDVFNTGRPGPCEIAYVQGLDPVTQLPYVANPTVGARVGGGTQPLIGFPGYIGYDPTVDVGQNNGEGFFTDLSGHELPNAPNFTATITADYTVPLPSSWLMTLHTDLYYQSEAWTRIFNTEGYDKLKAYSNINLAAIFTNEDAGWKVMAYVKNVLDRDSITGAFLNSDDTGLTTNVFLTEPRLYGLRVTKDWNGGAWWTGVKPNHPTGKPYPLTVEVGGLLQRNDAPYDPIQSAGAFPDAVSPARFQNLDLDRGEGGEIKLTFAPGDGPWHLSGGYRFGKTKSLDKVEARQVGDSGCSVGGPYVAACETDKYGIILSHDNYLSGSVSNHEEHALIDFEVGSDFGVGWGVASEVRAGIRYAEFTSQTHLNTLGTPDVDVPEYWALFKYTTKHTYETDLISDREFKGFGPTLSWDLSRKLIGNDEIGHLDVDLALTGGVLFGKQKTNISGDEVSTARSYRGSDGPVLADGVTVTTALPDDRSRSVSTPTFAAALGLSYEVGRVEVGAGYRWERFFDVLDAGFAEQKDYDRTFDGPYFKIAVGFGG